jgi:hypothetical protein
MQPPKNDVTIVIAMADVLGYFYTGQSASNLGFYEMYAKSRPCPNRSTNCTLEAFIFNVKIRLDPYTK